MDTYAIRRLNAWSSPEEVEQIGARSKEVADSDFPDDVRWIRKHARRIGMPADQIMTVADTVVIRPDPEPASV